MLFVPAESDILKYRVALWGLAAIATSKEWYDFTSNEYCHRLGPFAWMAYYTAGVEMLTVIKCQEDFFQEPFPAYVKVMWICIAFFLLWLLMIVTAN